MQKSILFLFLLVLFSVSTLWAQNNTIYAGHRGASYLAPENTLISYKVAWDMDVVAAECDIMLTKDKQVIVFHDKTGKRLTGEDFTVKEVNYEDIKDYPIKLKESNLPNYSGQNIPLLSDLLQFLPKDRTLIIEIKTGEEILPYMQKIIDTYWKSGNLVFIAFDFETILATKKLYPSVPCFYLSAFRFDINRKYKKIIESDLDGVNLRHKIISKRMAEKFIKKDKDVWCWTVNDPKDAVRMIEYGVSAITTDRPKWLKDTVTQGL